MWQSFRVDQTPSNAIDGITSSKKHAVIHFINVSHVRSPKPFDLINIFKSLLFAEKSFYRYCSIWIWFLSWNIYDSIALLFTGNFILFHIVLCSIRFVLLSSGVPHFLTSFEVVINLCTAPVILAISDSIQSCSYSHFSHGAHYNLKLSQNVTMRSKQNFSSAGKHKKKGTKSSTIEAASQLWCTIKVATSSAATATQIARRQGLFCLQSSVDTPPLATRQLAGRQPAIRHQATSHPAIQPSRRPTSV